MSLVDSLSDRNMSILIETKDNPLWNWTSEFTIALLAVVVVTLTQLKGLIAWWYHFAPSKEYDAVKGKAFIPQVPNLPIFGSFFRACLPGSDPYKVTMEWVVKYGRIFKLKFGWENFYMVNDPAMLQKILSSSNPHHLNKHRRVYSTIFSGCVQNGLVASEHEVWNPHRRILSRSFKYNSLQHQLDIMNLHAKQLIAELPAELVQCEREGRSPNVTEIMHHTTIKSILHTILGLDLFSDEERDLFQVAFQAAKSIVVHKLLRPWLLLKPIWKLHPLSKELQRLEQIGYDFIQMVVDRFRAKRGKSPQAITVEEDDVGSRRFKRMMEEMLDSGLSDRNILDESMTILIAGHETTSWSLTFLLLHLVLNPAHQEKCREEVDQLFRSKVEGASHNLDLSMDDLSSLKYLERCIYENLRLLPIIPLFLRRLDMPIKLDDEIELAAGTTICIIPWTLHRLPEIWPNPDKFEPDRFLPENVKKRHPYAYLPFSAGPRNCIGWKSAIMNIKVLAAWILRHYEIETTDKWEDIKLTYSVTIATEKELNLTLKRRNSFEVAENLED